MDVVLDANILIADPWLRSQRIRILLDYLDRTSSRLWLPYPVQMEVEAYVERLFRDRAEHLGAAINAACRHGLEAVPQFEVNSSVDATFRTWKTRFAEVTEPVVNRVEPDPAVFSDALRRAIHRVPPCREDGSQIRDAILWLTVLAHYKAENHTNRIAFISSNTRDFAGPGRTSLKERLLEDIERYDTDMVYFPTLEDFIKDVAHPYLQITREWLEQQLDLEEVTDLVQDELEGSTRYFRPSSMDYRGYYEPAGDPRICSTTVSVEGFYVWEFESAGTEISINCSAHVEAEIDCDRVARPNHPSGWDSVEDEEYPLTKTLTCAAELLVAIIAKVNGGQIVSIALENYEPLL